MASEDHLDRRTGGLGCAVCGEAVPRPALHVLAQRDELSVVRVDCHGCGSTTLAFLDGSGDEATAPITSDDVLDMHELLAGWRGGLKELLSRRIVGSGEVR